jgi:hypothetical protein
MGKVKIGRWEIDEETLAQQHQAAVTRGAARLQNEPQAQSVAYDPTQHRLIIELKNGVVLHLPCALIQGLATAQPHEIAQVRIGVRGASLHWEALGVGFSLAGLLAGIFGTEVWMAELGRQGGRATSAAKVAAARSNGKKGGRPRRVVSAAPALALAEEPVEYAADEGTE